ncbi:hypothetical protein [Streptomyces albus]|uniref:hypothetical protein n=1 Tax=Streptomyces albus TaxID=1888 RepID=UPI000A7AF00A|nr:hypothetical protein [Streptomyces albus]
MRTVRVSGAAATRTAPRRGAGAANGRRGRAGIVAACAVTALLCASAGAQASPGPSVGRAGGGAVAGGPTPRSDNWHGPVVTHPGQPEVHYARGEVCPFPADATFPVVDMTQKTWTNDTGDPVYAVISGPLVMEVTNRDTGKTVRRDLSGTGSLSYPDPGSSTRVLSGGDWGVGLHTDDGPVHNKWIVSRGFMAVRISESGGETRRELLELEGPYEDLCKTLAS